MVPTGTDRIGLLDEGRLDLLCYNNRYNAEPPHAEIQGRPDRQLLMPDAAEGSGQQAEGGEGRRSLRHRDGGRLSHLAVRPRLRAPDGSRAQDHEKAPQRPARARQVTEPEWLSKDLML